MKTWLKDKAVVVTGASSGIGAEIVKLLTNKYNCTVLGVARNEDKLNNFKNSLGEKCNNFYICVGDVSKKESWDRILEQAKQLNCQILINNAGTMLNFKKALNTTEEEVSRVFKTNFMSTYYGFTTFCEYLKSVQNGAIVNVCSASAICSIPGQSVYSASKSAQVAFSKIASCEERKNLFIATYLPGFTRTSLFTTKDNSKPIFDEKALKLVNKFSMPSDKMARKIVKSLKRKKRYKVFGKDAKLLKTLNGLAPVKSSDFYYNLFKKVNLDSFSDLF